MAKKNPPAQHILRRLFWHDEVDGCLRWNGNRDSEGIVKGDRAAIQGQDGYMHVNCFGQKWKEHILVWAFYNPGKQPVQVDHKDQDRTNNRRANLRGSTVAQNLANRGKWGKNKIKGVFPTDNGRFRSLITINGKTRYLGTFDTPKEASNAYNEAAVAAFGSFAGTGDTND